MSDNNRNTDPNGSDKNASEKNNSGPPVPENVADSDANNCRICFEQLTNRSLTDSCLHGFCFGCLRLWSQTHNTCPLCRHPYNYILANIDSQNDFNLQSVATYHNHHHYYHQNSSIQIRDQIQELIREQQLFDEQQRDYLYFMLTLSGLDINSIEYLRSLETLSLLADEQSARGAVVSNIRTNLRNTVLSHLNNMRNCSNGMNSVPTNQQNLSPELQQQPVPQIQQNQPPDNGSDEEGYDSDDES